ncbi:MAG: SCO6745 family protein [Acidimicrobiales bacterium]
MDTVDATTAARRLGGALEPVIGGVYFAPEAHRAYEVLGFDPSPGEINGVMAPEGVAYFTSRGSVMGQVPGTVVAAAFAVFEPNVVVRSVARGRQITDAATVCAARDEGALGQLERVLGPQPDGLAPVTAALARAVDGLATVGRPLAAGVQSLPVPDHPLGALWRHGDLLREFRGDSHTIAWVHAGLDAVEIGLLTERYWGLPLRTYTRTRAWSDAAFDAAEERLRSRGLLDDAGDFTDAGRATREQIEVDTDRPLAPVLAAIGDDLPMVLERLAAWGRAIRDAKGYPGSGPHDLATAAGDRS